jgi:hypothetical protein
VFCPAVQGSVRHYSVLSGSTVFCPAVQCSVRQYSVLSGITVFCPAVKCSSTLSHNRQNFLELFIEHATCVLILSTNLGEIVVNLRRLQEVTLTKVGPGAT